MRKRLIIVALVALCGGCGKRERVYPEPFLPTIDGWHALESEIVVGAPARFQLKLTWDQPLPDGLVWETTLDRWARHAGGLPADPVHEPRVIRDGNAGEIVEIPTANTGYLFPEAGGKLYVCQDREYPTCVEAKLEKAWTVVRGGLAVAIDFPVDAVQLVVGEQRPLQPMPTAYTEPNAAGVKSTTTSHEALTYRSSAEAIVSVDALGVLDAHAPGTATVTASAGAASGSIEVTVTADAMHLPKGPVLVTPRWTPLPIGNSYLDGRTPDTLAISSDGRPAFVLAPDSASPVHPGVSHPLTLNLVRWTGSGLGFERISDWWEQIRAPFFDIGLDGRLVAGWIAQRGTGLVVLDRADAVVAGGWQRRTLPMHPDLATAAPRTDGPQWATDFGPYNDNEGISNLKTNVIIGTLPAPDGIWVAYGWGDNFYLYPHELPATFQTTCVRTVRLAHVTATAITVDEVERLFISPVDFCNEVLDGRGEAYWRIALGPPENGSDRPSMLVESVLPNAGKVTRRYQHGATGWAQTMFSPLLAWSPGFAVAPQPLLGGDLMWGALGPGGAAWVGGTVTAQRTGPYGNKAHDSVVGPAFGAIEGSWVNSFAFDSGRGGYGQIATVTWGDPPDAPPTTSLIWRTWLYQYPLPPAPHPEDSDLLGTRLSATANTPRYQAILPLSDGSRVLIGRPISSMTELSASRSSGPAQPFDVAVPITGVAVPSNQQWTAWADGTRVWIAQGPGPVTLQLSTDHGVSATAGVTIPSAGLPIRGVSTSPGVSWLLTAPGGSTSSAAGAQLWRLDDTSGVMMVTQRPAGSWPGLVVYADSGDAIYSGLAVGPNSLWVFCWLMKSMTSEHQLVTRQYGFDGTLISEHAAVLGRPMAQTAAVTGTGVLVMPMYDLASGMRAIMRSTDGGASWTLATTLTGVLDDYTFPQPLLLRDGRLAMVATRYLDADAEQVAILTTTDGVSWSAPQWVRPQGGHLQRVWAAAIDSAGALLVHLGDAGTICGFLARDATIIKMDDNTWNKTGLEGVLVRVPM